MTKSLVEIGIPIAGRTAYIGPAVESILAQTLTEWRLTIAEDGAETPEIRAAVEPYLGDPRITYRPAGEHIGPPKVKTGLINQGDAPFVAILDDDDLWLPEFLERHVAFMQEHAEVGFVFCANTVIDGSGRETGRSRLVLAEGVHPSEEIVPKLIEHNLAASPTILVRRAAYEAVGAEFDERLTTIYDQEMWIRLAARFPVGYRASWDASYRQHANQSTIIDRGRRSHEILLMLDRADESIANAPQPIHVPPAIGQRRRAEAKLSIALDALEVGNRAEARQALQQAVRLRPSVVVDPRAPLALVGLVLPRRVGSLVGVVRTFALRHGLRGGRLESNRRR